MRQVLHLSIRTTTACPILGNSRWDSTQTIPLMAASRRKQTDTRMSSCTCTHSYSEKDYVRARAVRDWQARRKKTTDSSEQVAVRMMSGSPESSLGASVTSTNGTSLSISVQPVAFVDLGDCGVFCRRRRSVSDRILPVDEVPPGEPAQQAGPGFLEHARCTPFPEPTPTCPGRREAPW